MEALQPSAFIVFGATSDLAKKKLYPSLYALATGDALPEHFYLFGGAQEELSDDQLRSIVYESVKTAEGEVDDEVFDVLVANVSYTAMDVTAPDGFASIEDQIKAMEKDLGTAIQRIFYLALPPSLFPDVARQVETCRIGKDMCTDQEVLSRIMIEKPFGHDLASAKELDEVLKNAFDERQIYRIDHYLGKEPFQNILIFRFGNQLFENQWNNEHVSQIQINALETVGAEGRAPYYDDTGALRDMVQSHLLQFLAYLTMDEPKDLSADALHEAKEGVLANVRPFGGTPTIVRGQYDDYTGHEGVSAESSTETYVALAVDIDTPRWRGVPIYIRTGKQLSRKDTSAVVEFQQREGCVFTPETHPLTANVARINIAPNPGVSLRLNMHAPGTKFGALPASMHFCQSTNASGTVIADYETLLLDVMRGDRQLFAGSDEVLHAWRAVEPFMDHLSETTLHPYKRGVEQPAAADQLPTPNTHKWIGPIVDCDRA